MGFFSERRSLVFRAVMVTMVFCSFASGVFGSRKVEIFRDDFDGSDFDWAKWNSVNMPSQVNNELQFYTPKETWIQNGFAVIQSQRRDVGDRHYTSGRLDTKDKFQFRYGEVEFRAKLPIGKGIWPALWLVQWSCPAAVGCGSNWPPEIDIMEARGDIPNKITTTLFFQKYPNQAYKTNPFFGTDFTQDFHNFKVLWDPDQVRFYVDGQEVFSVTDPDAIPREEQYIIMNTAVGGDYPGNPDDSTPFPTHFLIDWVSVQQWVD